MAHYLLQVAYTPQAWSAMLKNPQNRIEMVAPALERLGGRFEGAWLAFGEYDIVAIMSLPDNVSAAAFSMAVSAGGSIKMLTTTPLMDVNEGVEAMRKAQTSGYQPPS
jgi:uncharacterized protein with GYD domain